MVGGDARAVLVPYKTYTAIRTDNIKAFNTISGITVGADLSCPPPIYRPPVGFHDIPPIFSSALLAFRGFTMPP